ncbi:IPTL-CTERM sorting domain-containing protein [Comamonas sp. JUb58]|uniref:IPTL-CTERM sorting domain-containing protein n=1 Tax=Comamonas sp. JUb58 TaxID=2485114 RepID=UPI00141508D9|nr:IPTL-CTERM sorting domain-containing protein [Comamonas sp. JUb58]
MSNRPPGTLTQDWYPGSGEDSFGDSAVSGDTHDTTFLASTGAQRFGGGLTASADPTYLDFQRISNLTARSATQAITAQQYIEFPFTTGTLHYADATAAPALFYFNAAATSKRWNMNGNSHPRAFGYAAYIVDASGSPVGDVIQQINDVTTVAGEDFQIVRPPDGPGPGVELQPGTAYALRFYLFGTAANADRQASWDDTLFAMSRQTLADIVVTASTVSVVPADAQNTYSYTFSVYNNGPDTAQALVSDPLPAAANGTTASWTCVLRPSATPCAIPAGSGAIGSVLQPLNVGETAVYAVSWTGPAITAAGSHTISALPQADSPSDPILSNNSAVVRVAPPPVVEIEEPAPRPTPVPASDAYSLALLALLLAAFGIRQRRRTGA